MDEKVRQRALRKLLHITFPDGKELCYKSATMTFVEALQTIDKDRLQKVKLEYYHLPLISQEIYPRFKDSMKPLGEGWYVNNVSSTKIIIKKFIELTLS